MLKGAGPKHETKWQSGCAQPAVGTASSRCALSSLKCFCDCFKTPEKLSASAGSTQHLPAHTLAQRYHFDAVYRVGVSRERPPDCSLAGLTDCPDRPAVTYKSLFCSLLNGAQHRYASICPEHKALPQGYHCVRLRWRRGRHRRPL
jgi:hypothetical protein